MLAKITPMSQVPTTSMRLHEHGKSSETHAIRLHLDYDAGIVTPSHIPDADERATPILSLEMLHDGIWHRVDNVSYAYVEGEPGCIMTFSTDISDSPVLKTICTIETDDDTENVISNIMSYVSHADKLLHEFAHGLDVIFDAKDATGYFDFSTRLMSQGCQYSVAWSTHDFADSFLVTGGARRGMSYMLDCLRIDFGMFIRSAGLRTSSTERIVDARYDADEHTLTIDTEHTDDVCFDMHDQWTRKTATAFARMVEIAIDLDSMVEEIREDFEFLAEA